MPPINDQRSDIAVKVRFARDSAGTQTGQTRIVSCDPIWFRQLSILFGVCQSTSCTRQALAAHWSDIRQGQSLTVIFLVKSCVIRCGLTVYRIYVGSSHDIEYDGRNRNGKDCARLA
jgi:hypothetical protein